MWRNLIVCIMIFFQIAIFTMGSNNNSEQETQQIIIEGTIESEILSPVVDEIALKQEEMRNTTILVQTRQGCGSGTIIDCLETDVEEIFEYIVLSNAHVTYTRFITYLRKVDSLTGRIKTETVDTGCEIITFDHQDRKCNQYCAKIVVEDTQLDLVILSFKSTQKLAIAKIANDEMLSRVRVFDEVFTSSCQLGWIPSPTVGIVSQILIGNNGEKEWIIYSHTAQISPGSSGGGLYKKYDQHYYLIGIPFRVLAYRDQWIPHLAHAISITTAQEFIDQNSLTEGIGYQN